MRAETTGLYFDAILFAAAAPAACACFFVAAATGVSSKTSMPCFRSSSSSSSCSGVAVGRSGMCLLYASGVISLSGFLAAAAAAAVFA